AFINKDNESNSEITVDENQGNNGDRNSPDKLTNYSSYCDSLWHEDPDIGMERIATSNAIMDDYSLEPQHNPVDFFFHETQFVIALL
ncbi:hypothetical protein RFI_07958, partial [Reticulomyxa filosa]